MAVGAAAVLEVAVAPEVDQAAGQVETPGREAAPEVGLAQALAADRVARREVLAQVRGEEVEAETTIPPAQLCAAAQPDL